MSIDIAELRKLLAEKHDALPDDKWPIEKQLWDALPELLDEIERLTKKAAMSRYGHDAATERIAQLEAALREISAKCDADAAEIADKALEEKP